MKYNIPFLLLIGFSILGCDRKESVNFQGGDFDSPPPVLKVEAGLSNLPPEPKDVPTNIERKLIKNGELTFETSDINKTKVSIEAICKELGAYTSNESQNNYGEELRYNQTIRVTADKFDLLIQKIEAEASSVTSKNINTQDVTEEFIDVEARLKTKKELETRYREILKQAKSVQEILSIESQIASVRSSIESMEGRLKYLSSQVAYSTLNVSYYETIGTDFGFGSKLGKALGSGWDSFLSFLIGLVTAWPFLIILSLLVWLIVRLIRRKRKKTDK